MMKNLIILCTSLLVLATLIALMSFQNSQPRAEMQQTNNDPYEGEWNSIDSLEQQGLPKSALEQVEILFGKAKKENNPSQIVKSLIYRSKYQSQLEEDGSVKAIYRLQEEVKTMGFPAKSVLQSMLGEMYRKYLDNNYWRINNRTTTLDFSSNDIKTWTIEQLITESSRLYLASIQEEKLIQLPIEDFEAIVLAWKDAKELRPTLYDLLVHRAIDHFSNERTYLTSPAYKFVLEQEEAFARAETFVDLNFATKDSTSFKFRTLLLLQNALKRHLNDDNPAALVDADLKRLSFVKNQSVSDIKDSLYVQALDQLFVKYGGISAGAEILYHKALYHQSKGGSYQPKVSDEFKWEYKKAKEFCDRAIEDYTGSYGAKKCQTILANLQRKSLNLNSETVNIPNQPILTLLEYRNVSQAYAKIVKIEEGERRDLQKLRVNELLQNLNKRVPVSEKNFRLPDDGDLQQHRIEFMFDGVDLGYYAIMLSDNPSYTNQGGAVAYLYTRVSNLAYLHRRNHQNAPVFTFVDRTTGRPMAGVKGEFFTNQYDRKKRTTVTRKIGEAHSDQNGLLLPKLDKKTYFTVKFSKGNDILDLNDSYSYSTYRSEPRKQLQTHFFLDRAIYRPGQTIYFKGILLEKSEEDYPAIMTNKKATVTLYDANGQEVEVKEMKSNEYGTISGSFVAPKSGLLGRMSIYSSVGNVSKSFRVEEYKRPKFEVVLEPLDGTYALGDEVIVSGNAKAFAGNSIDGAMVKYRVVREVRFPWMPWWYWRRGYPTSGESMEIVNGETQTDADGKFSVNFMALPDRSITKDKKPAFYFTVYVDVIDITGETHSQQRAVNLGYLSLKADVAVDKQIDRSAEYTFKLNTENLDGQFQAAKGKINIYQLNAPDKNFINRYWEKPDRHIIDKSTFEKNFPYFAFQNEDDIQTWKNKHAFHEGTFNTETSKALKLDLSKWPVGHYAIVLNTQDPNGTAIEVKKTFQLYDRNQHLIPNHTLGWHQQSAQIYQPGETAKLFLATTAGPIYVLLEREQQRKIQNTQWLRLDNWHTQNIGIQEADRGNLHYHMAFVKHNRAFVWRETLAVPWSNKDLKIEYSTFRDKLKPGQEEEWRMKISGPKGEKVAAEMVAAMYDASLDEFASNSWHFSPFPTSMYAYRAWSPRHFGSQYSNLLARNWQPQIDHTDRIYPYLNWFNYFYPGGYVAKSLGRGNLRTRSFSNDYALAEAAPLEAPAVEADELEIAAPKTAEPPPPPPPPPGEENKEGEGEPSEVKVRTNLKETVFFMPDLKTDEDGNVIVKFTMNEALTRWKFLGMAHTKDLEIALTQKEVITQKELMVQPNAPRFLREGDEIEYTAKVSNLTEEVMNGQAQLLLFDALSMKSVDGLLENVNSTVAFEAKAGQSARLAWRIKIPKGQVMALSHRVIAKSGNYADGEESVLPILTNRMLVTEALPLPVRGGQTKEFSFKSLQQAGRSKTLQHHQFSLEFTSNPAWYAVQAMPYLMEYPYACTEQIFNRYYANSLATTVANSHPKIKEVFDSWAKEEVLESNLNKNQELKTALLEETPWVLQAQSEAQQRKNIALLFDLNRMSDEQTADLARLDERQSLSGGFSWFPGGKDSWYVTQYLVEGLGHLDRLQVKQVRKEATTWKIAQNAIGFIDRELEKHYQALVRRVEQGYTSFDKDHLHNMTIHYLYSRSFFLDQPMDESVKKAYQYYLGQAEKYWLKRGLYEQGMIALALYRAEREDTPAKIVKSLKERVLQNEELGAYWKYNAGYYWYQLPIETHSLMIELFAEVAKDMAMVDELKIWLLKNKQTNHWKTTKATASAVYALLMHGDNWLLENEPVEIHFPKMKKKAYTAKLAGAQNYSELGTGYFKTDWKQGEVNSKLGTIKVKNPNEVVAWGAMYWQYFEDLDKINIFEETPLKINKKVFKESPSDKGPVIEMVTDEKKIHPGDKLVVRIELRVDRDMEYVHMKDLRASGLEPINVFSQYKWQGGLGYYESTGDVATNFFFDRLPKGTYVFEYPLRVNHKGDFSNGMTSIQCMYAPEFTSHSEGIRLKVD